MIYMDSGLITFPSIHDKLALQLCKYKEEESIAEWMTEGEITLIQKPPLKGTACLSMMWKILIVEIKEKIYEWLVCFYQKDCYKGTRGIDDLLFSDEHILKGAKQKQKNGNKKTNNIVLQTWIIACLKK